MSPMTFVATRRSVFNRGKPPESFLRELVEWGRRADASIFAPNPNPRDIYATVYKALGPWKGLEHRRAVMLEVMRVHAGFESAWNWKEGVDTTNRTSMTHIEGQETGIFQVSFNSTWLGDKAMTPYAKEHGISTPQGFIVAMKANHWLAMDYYARLMRVSVQWAGPVKRHEIDEWLRRDAVDEFRKLLAPPSTGILAAV